MLVGGGLGSGGRGTGSLGDKPWMWIAWALAEATWLCLRRTERGPKLRQATQIPTQHTIPTLTLQHTEHIVQLDLASTAGRIAHATRIHLTDSPGPPGQFIGPLYAVSAQTISLADVPPPWIVQYSTVVETCEVLHTVYSLVTWLGLLNSFFF